MPVTPARKSVRPRHQVRTALGLFIRVGCRGLVGSVEIVVQLDVDLLACDASPAKSEYPFAAAFDPANPPVARRIQAIADLVVVRQWHLVQQLSNKAGRIHGFPV